MRSFVGHGIGEQFHTDLHVPHYYEPRLTTVIEEGMTFTIEPMITIGAWEHDLWDDGWTAVTVDRRRTAQFEHTLVVVTADGCDVLDPPLSAQHRCDVRAPGRGRPWARPRRPPGRGTRPSRASRVAQRGQVLVGVEGGLGVGASHAQRAGLPVGLEVDAGDERVRRGGTAARSSRAPAWRPARRSRCGSGSRTAASVRSRSQTSESNGDSSADARTQRGSTASGCR